MDRHNVTDEDEGKAVVNSNGEKVGMVTGIEGGTAYVNPDPGITDSIKSKLGWEDVDTDDYPLREDRIETITGDEIRLQSDL